MIYYYKFLSCLIKRSIFVAFKVFREGFVFFYFNSSQVDSYEPLCVFHKVAHNFFSPTRADLLLKLGAKAALLLFKADRKKRVRDKENKMLFCITETSLTLYVNFSYLI